MKRILNTIESMNELLNKGASVEIHAGSPIHDIIQEAVDCNWEVVHSAALKHLAWCKSHNLDTTELEEALRI